MKEITSKAYDIFKVLPKDGQERALNYMKALKEAEKQKKKEDKKAIK